MSKEIYAGANGTARKVQKAYVGVNGVAREVKRGYVGVNGVAKLFYQNVIGFEAATVTLGPSLTYNGSQQTKTVTVTMDGVTLTQGTDYTVTGNTGTNAGNYTMTITGTGDYEGTIREAWSIAKLSLTKPTVSGSYTYNGSSRSCTVSGMDATYIEQSGTTTATNAGTYTVTFALKSTSNTQWSDGTTANVSRTWSIAKLSLTQPTVSGSYTYNGSSQSCTVSGMNATYITQSGTTTATNAGTYTVTFALKDTSNTQWSGGGTGAVSRTWSIAKLSLTKPTVSGSFTYNTFQHSCTISNMDATYIEQSGTTTATNAGTYTVTFALKSTSNTQWSDGTTANVNRTWTIARATGSISVSPTTMSITGAVGATETATITYNGDGSISVSSSNTSVATASRSGRTITVTFEGDGSATITIALGAGTNYTGASCTLGVSCESVNVFGVMWDMTNSSPACTRLTPSNDPNNYVTISITTELTAAIGTTGGSSPFDAYMPWAGMIQYNADSTGNVSTYSNVSVDDCVVAIPEFYCKIVYDLYNSRMYFYVTNSASMEGFVKHPGSGRYVGRYTTGSGYVSKSGQAPLTSISRASARSGSANKGSKWWQYDFATYSAICMLYIVEWANWDSQSKIGKGHTNVGSSYDYQFLVGGTDAMTYHTGRAAGTDGMTAVQYRWIENLWGNVDQWVDGVNFRYGQGYVCTEPLVFADATTVNYTNTGITTTVNGYIQAMNNGNLAWGFMPNAAGGSATTYVPDILSTTSNGWGTMYVGGSKGDGLNAGLFKCATVSTNSTEYIGTRLMIVP